MAAGGAPNRASLTAGDVRRKCDGNPVGPDGKRIHGTLDLDGAQVEGKFPAGSVDLRDVNLRSAVLCKCYFERTLFCGSDLSGASIDGTNFYVCDFTGGNLRGAKGIAEFAQPTLKGANIAEVDLTKANGTWTPFESIDWHLALYAPDLRTDLGRMDHNEMAPRRLFSGYNFARRSLQGFDFHGAKLNGANFEKADLSQADLTDADLTDAELGFARFGGAKLTAAQVRRAKNWLRALLDPELVAELTLPADQNTRFITGNFSECDFKEFDFRNQKLAGVDFSSANLNKANLSGQDLAGAHFDRAILDGADLNGAKMHEAEGLVAWQFRGTDVTDAELPEHIEQFKAGIEQVKSIASAVAKQFLTMLAACLYCVVTIAGATDAALILGSSTLALPVVRTPIPIVGFYKFAPLLLITVFLYFQVNLHRMWEAVAKLPAIFPDGRRIDERVYPWMLIQKVRAHYSRLSKEYTFVPRLENVLGSALAYGAVPLTLLYFVYGALVKHDGALSGWHIVLFTLALLIAFQFHRYAKDTLHGVPPASGVRYELRSSWRWLLCLGLGALLWFKLPSPAADLRDAELSTKPDGWVEGQTDLSGVKGAKLAGVHLEHARMDDAFLVKADLEGANLGGAILAATDLRGADFAFADLRSAFLDFANFQGARLDFAKFRVDELKHASNWMLAHYTPEGLQQMGLPTDHEENLNRRDFRTYQIGGIEIGGIDFYRADLTGANFEGKEMWMPRFDQADLSNANLRHCKLAGSSFRGTKLIKTNLCGAFLEGATGLTEPQLREAILDADTTLPPAFQHLIPQPVKKKP